MAAAVTQRKSLTQGGEAETLIAGEELWPSDPPAAALCVLYVGRPAVDGGGD